MAQSYSGAMSGDPQKRTLSVDHVMFVDSQYSEFLPPSQDMAYAMDMVEEEGSGGSHHLVQITSHPTSGSRFHVVQPKAPDQPVIPTLLKAPPRGRMEHIPPVTPSDDNNPFTNEGKTIVESPHTTFDIIAWYHDVQWGYTRDLHRTNILKPFSSYISETHNSYHFNVYLMGISLETRQEVYSMAVDIYHKINAARIENPGAVLDDLLAKFACTKPVYTRVGKILSGEPPPKLTFSESLIVDREALELKSSCPGTNDPEEHLNPSLQPEPTTWDRARLDQQFQDELERHLEIVALESLRHQRVMEQIFRCQRERQEHWDNIQQELLHDEVFSVARLLTMKKQGDSLVSYFNNLTRSYN